MALKTEYPTAEIYTEEIKQGLQTPAFFIQYLEPTHRLFRGHRYFRTCPMCIQYFPATSEYRMECADVAENLSMALDVLTLPDSEGKMRGADMSSTVTDGVLSFFVTFSYFGVLPDDVGLMGEDFTMTTNITERIQR